MDDARKLELFDNMLDWLSWHCEYDCDYIEALDNCGFTLLEKRQVLHDYAGYSWDEVDKYMNDWGEEFGEDVKGY